jgi:NAD(P)-dependent dehydrogenase (short-subunit alcohol dehydrogenase family)
MKVCIVGASGKLGQYMIQHSLDRGYEVVGVCRPASVAKLDAFKERITVIPGATDDREVIQRAVGGCDGVLVVLVVLVPRGVHGYSTGTAQAVLDYALPDARLVFSCGWHISLDGQDVYSWKLKALVNIAGPLAKLARFADLDDQVGGVRRQTPGPGAFVSNNEVVPTGVIRPSPVRRLMMPFAAANPTLGSSTRSRSTVERQALFALRSRLRRRGFIRRTWSGSSTLPVVTSRPRACSTASRRRGCWPWSTASALAL